MLFKYHVQKKQQSTGKVKLLSHGSLLVYQASAQCRLQLWCLNCAHGSYAAGECLLASLGVHGGRQADTSQF